MRVALTSDLHRGFSNKTDRLQRKYFERWVAENGQPDVLVLAGDIASHKPKEQVNTMLRTVRSHFTCPVLAVRGNHDFWHGYESNSRGYSDGFNPRPHPSLTTLNLDWEENCARHGVTNLEGNVVSLPGAVGAAGSPSEDYLFGGWLSWWSNKAPDQWRMSAQVSLDDMRMLEEQTFSNMIHRLPDAYDTEKLILVTHMAPNLSGLWSSRPRVLPDCLALLAGHTHLLMDGVISSTGVGSVNEEGNVPDMVRVLNVGPDYDRPSIYTLDTSTGVFSGTGGNTRRHF